MKINISKIETLYSKKQTVFSFKDLGMVWGVTDPKLIMGSVNHYVRNNKLYRISRGFYALNKDYNSFEYAIKKYSPAYVSFESVLIKEGLVFQPYTSTFVASRRSKEVLVDGRKYIYRKIKDGVLLNPIGLKIEDDFTIANKERAMLDTLYIKKDFYFDNLRSIDWNKAFGILPIYNNKELEKRVKELYDDLNK